MIALQDEEEFDSSLSHESTGVQNSDLLMVLEDRSEFGCDAFALLDYMLPMHFYLIASTDS